MNGLNAGNARNARHAKTTAHRRISVPAGRGPRPAALDRGAVHRSHTAGLFPRHAWPIGRRAGLGASWDVHHGLLAVVVALLSVVGVHAGQDQDLDHVPGQVQRQRQGQGQGEGQSHAALFRQGNQHYQTGDFERALESYLRILDHGTESGALYYNIGNTYFKLGQIGQAILYYERARRSMPGDDDVLANLELVRSQTTDQITPLPRFWLLRVVDAWVALLPRTALIWLVATAYVSTMTVVALMILRLRSSQAAAVWGRRVATAGAALTIVFGVNLGVRELGVGHAGDAVILAAEVTVQSAPSDDGSLQIFVVHEGTTVRVERRSEAWVEIVLEDGKVGWIRSDQLAFIG